MKTTANCIDGDYKVQVTVTTPGRLDATTYCSAQNYRFSTQEHSKETVISFDPNIFVEGICD